MPNERYIAMLMTAAGITVFQHKFRLIIRSQQVHKFGRRMSTLSRWKETDDIATNEEMEEIDIKGPSWMPHPRTGIYFPAGQERVMDDIPSGAASLPQTYWLRNEDGVDKPDPDHLPIIAHNITTY